MKYVFTLQESITNRRIDTSIRLHYEEAKKLIEEGGNVLVDTPETEWSITTVQELEDFVAMGCLSWKRNL